MRGLEYQAGDPALDAVAAEVHEAIAANNLYRDLNGATNGNHTIVDGAAGEEIDRAEQSYDNGGTTDALTLFLKAAGEVKLLTAPQEVELSKRIEKGFIAAHIVRKAVSGNQLDKADRKIDKELTAKSASHPELKNPTEVDIKFLMADGAKAKQHMMEANVRLVVSIAKKYQGHGLSLLDLIMEGTLGLSRAAEKFDWRRGYKFSTYATWWIRQSVQRGVANHKSLIRVPVHVVERQQKLDRVRSRYASAGRGEPSEEQLVAETGIEKNYVEEALGAAVASVSLNKPVGYDGEELGDRLADEDSLGPLNETEETLRTQALRKMLEALPERERRILELRYGFEDAPATLEAIGHELDLTRERVRQLENQALGRLKAMRGVEDLIS